MKLGYKDNIAWQKNHRAVIKTAKLIEGFPKTVPFRKISEQLFSSISSVGANIAEGCSDFKGNEYPRYLGIAISSAHETDHWLTIIESLVKLKGESGLLDEIKGLNLETIKILLKIKQAIEKKRRETSGF